MSMLEGLKKSLSFPPRLEGRGKLRRGSKEAPRDRQATNPVLKFSVATAALILACLAARKADAQQYVDFDDAINNRIVSSEQWGDLVSPALAAHLRTGSHPNEFWVTFRALQPNQEGGLVGATDVYRTALEIDDGPGESIVMRRKASVPSVPGYNSSEGGSDPTLLQIDRGDGVLINISFPGSDVFINESDRWNTDGTCPNNGVASASPAVDGRLKLAAAVSAVGGLDKDVCYLDNWETAPDLCEAAETDGVVDPYESDIGQDELNAPEARVDDEYGDVLAVTRSNAPFPGVSTFFMRRPPSGDTRYMDWNETDGTFADEDPPAATPEALGRVWAMLPNSREFPLMTPSGRRIVLVVHRGVNTETGGAILRASAFEKDLTTGLLKNVVISGYEISEEIIDSDNDDIPDDDDTCALRANAGAIDTNLDGRGDACNADCRDLGEFPPHAAGTINSSGLRICKSELGYAEFDEEGVLVHPGAYEFGDGSAAHSSTDVELDDDSNIAVQPGQEIRFIHSPGPHEPLASDPLPSGDFVTPSDSGNSVHLEVYDTTRPNGTAGEFSFSYHPIDDPFGTPVTVGPIIVDPRDGDAPFIWDSPGVIVGGESAAEGTDYLVRLGSEQEPLPCATPCECGGPCDPDAGPGTSDAGADSGTDGSTDEDAPAEQPDSGSDAPADQPDAGADAQGTGAEPTPDAAMADMTTDREDANQNRADAGTDDGRKTPKPDSPEPPIYSDSGPVRTDMGNGPTQPGCGACDLGSAPNTPENQNAPLGPLSILGLAAAAGLERRRRQTREQAQKAVKVAA